MKKFVLAICLFLTGIASSTAVCDSKFYLRSEFCPNVQNVEVCSKRDDVIRVVKQLHYATANGDVAKLKKLTTPEFYKKQYPLSDESLRKELLSVPYEKRQNLIKHIDEYSEFTVLFSNAGDYATVWADDTVTGKSIRFGLIYDFDAERWLICDYEY